MLQIVYYQLDQAVYNEKELISRLQSHSCTTEIEIESLGAQTS